MVRPAEGGGSGRTRAEQAALDAAADRFDDYGAQFENTVAPLGTCHDNITAGAGELADELATGNAAFLLGWREALLACSETAGIIAGNIGNFYLDLSDVDIDQSVVVAI